MTFTIPLAPITKKNHQQIYLNRATGKRFISQSKQYKAYEAACLLCIPRTVRQKIDCKVNLKATFYTKTRGRVDLVNLLGALQDVLVLAGVLVDDNCNVVVSTDGSRVLYDKENPRTVVEINRVTE